MSESINDSNIKLGKRMDDLNDKALMIEKIVELHPKRVLDLGAGTGLISKLISEHHISVDAVDHEFKNDERKNTKYLTYYSQDIVDYIRTTNQKYDCIILSAILHELDPTIRRQLALGLNKIVDKEGCSVIIREPYYERLDNGLVRPFKSMEIQDNSNSLILDSISAEDMITWNSAYKKHLKKHDTNTKSDIYARAVLSNLENECPSTIHFLNLAFAWSYGDDSWKREQHEYRYAYPKDLLIQYAKRILGSDIEYTAYEYYNKDYQKYFKERKLPEEIVKGLEYTNCFMVFKNK